MFQTAGPSCSVELDSVEAKSLQMDPALMSGPTLSCRELVLRFSGGKLLYYMHGEPGSEQNTVCKTLIFIIS